MSNEKEYPNMPIEIVRGLPCPSVARFTRKNVEDAMDFMPEEGDTIIASYPKTGTTWMQYTIMQILSGGELFPSFDDMMRKNFPFLEMAGIEPVKAQSKPRFYKHHLPYDMVQKNSESKCIYTYRHPEDTIVSFYHFYKAMQSSFTMEFDDFFEAFLAGRCPYGNYFRHVLSFYEHRADENLLMVSYEKLHADRKQEILRIAKFLGEEYHQNLSVDESLLDGIIERTSFDYMKKNLTVTHPDALEDDKKKAGDDKKKAGEESKKTVEFFRKGIVGDGKSVLTDSQRQLLQRAAEEILKETSIIVEWYPQ